jgi:hypothetical protein
LYGVVPVTVDSPEKQRVGIMVTAMAWSTRLGRPRLSPPPLFLN